MAKTKEPTELLATEAQALDFVDSSKVYEGVIQLGANRRWRQYGSGRWKRESEDTDASGNKLVTSRHHPAIHEVGPLSGKVWNGVIANHNAWIEKNKHSRPGGQIERQMLVLSMRESDAEPEDKKRGPLTLRDVASIAETTARAVCRELLQSLK